MSDDPREHYSVLLKTVAVGNAGVGKTCMFITHYSGEYPDTYIPTVFDNYVQDCTYGGQTVGLGLFDTGGAIDYHRLRPLSYPGTHAFTLLFDVSRPKELKDIKSYWTPELRQHCPDVPIILVASKIDLRSQGEAVSKEQGLEMAEKIGAVKYHEISSLTSIGLKELFEDIVHIGFQYYNTASARTRRSKKCQIL